MLDAEGGAPSLTRVFVLNRLSAVALLHFSKNFYDSFHAYTGIEFKDFILGFRQSTFLCTTLKCIEKFRIPFIKSGIPASNLGSSEARNPAKFAAWYICTA